MAIFSCLDCDDREVGCHNKCDKYKREKAEYVRKENERRSSKNEICYTYFGERKKKRDKLRFKYAKKKMLHGGKF